jgi:BON domain-containing protein
MRYSNRSAILTLLLSICIAVSACSRRTSDEQIAKDIQQKAATDEDTKGAPVTVDAKQGKVTLTGQVRTPAAQKKLEQIANSEPGNTGVDDETTIDPDAVGTPELASAMAAARPPVQKPKPQPIIVPSGTTLTITTSQPLSSKNSQAGQTFLATLAQPISVDGRPALPKGSTVSGRVVSAKAKGKIKGEAELSLTLSSISVRDHTYDISTNVLSGTSKGKGKRTAATTAGGAAGGALIGGIAGGGKGAGIGALIGAGAGFIGGAATGNKQVEIPAEAALSFTLTEPLTLPPRSE